MKPAHAEENAARLFAELNFRVELKRVLVFRNAENTEHFREDLIKRLKGKELGIRDDARRDKGLELPDIAGLAIAEERRGLDRKIIRTAQPVIDRGAPA